MPLKWKYNMIWPQSGSLDNRAEISCESVRHNYRRGHTRNTRKCIAGMPALRRYCESMTRAAHKDGRGLRSAWTRNATRESRIAGRGCADCGSRMLLREFTKKFSRNDMAAGRHRKGRERETSFSILPYRV